jgi:hypothetical protein
MSGLAIAALIAAVVSIAVYGAALAWAAPRREWTLLVTVAAAALPLSWLAYYVLRAPLSAGVDAAFGPELARWVWPLYAPLTEEPAKLLLLAAPWFAHRVTRANAAHVGTAIGLGFGVGEIALATDLVRASPDAAASPWWQFTGFISERYMVCLVHGAFTATALAVWRSAKGGLGQGLGAAMGLHLIANLPVFILPMLIADPAQRGAAISLWLLLFWSAAVLWLLMLGRRSAATEAKA